MKNGKVIVPKKELVREHSRLLHVLKTGKGAKKEHAKQKKELSKIKKVKPKFFSRIHASKV